MAVVLIAVSEEPLCLNGALSPGLTHGAKAQTAAMVSPGRSQPMAKGPRLETG